MKLAVALIATVEACMTWEEWAAEHGFNGADDTMKVKYEANVVEIDALNADPEQTATFDVNQFSGMSFGEFSSRFLNLVDSAETDLPALGEVPVLENRASDIDWDVTPVKNQGSCGSCWAFGTMGSIEHRHKVKTGTTVDLAEQQLVDCDKVSMGCSGGLPTSAMNYLANKDIFTTASYPYVAKNGACTSGTASGVKITGHQSVDKTSSGLESALADGAVTVIIKADASFQHYKSGVLANPPTPCGLNHAVLATGYGTDFWKIKNSWGTTWGEAGFIRFAKSEAGCGPFGLFYKNPSVPLAVNADVQV